MSLTRRNLLAGVAVAAGALTLESAMPAAVAEKELPAALPRFGVSTYSFWQFRHEPQRDIQFVELKVWL